MKILYVYDALCGWCYGFSPVIQEFVKKVNLDCEVISGGMITGDRVGPIGEVAPYIKTAYKDVEQRCGVQFGTVFLNDVLEEGSTIFTSIPAAIAMAIFKEKQPDQQVSFAAALQKAIYYDGIKPTDHDAYATIAANYGINAQEFVQKMDNPVYIEKAQTDFQLSAHLLVSGFPTVFLVNGNNAIAIARGYVDLERLEKQYEQAHQQLQQ
jgi:putative protein-disulfide isomerase